MEFYKMNWIICSVIIAFSIAAYCLLTHDAYQKVALGIAAYFAMFLVYQEIFIKHKETE